MYQPSTGMRFLTICKRTDGFCTETMDCQQYKVVDQAKGIETCPHKEGREIRMPKREKGVF